MTLEEFRKYCLQKADVTEHLPFDINTLVFKVGHKMFALTDLNNLSSLNLKCDPEKAVELRERHVEIIPGYHMNKKLWNSVSTIGALEDSLILELIDHSYYLVYESLTKKQRKEIESR
jgi:predicted DNA-binding protein (MmcQ/YjbR family)